MNYYFSKPSALLARYVKSYWAIEDCIPAGHEHTQRVVPNGLAELIFYLGDRPVSADSKNPINENTLVSGQSGGYSDIRISGRLSLFSIQFLPHGLSVFLDIPLSELYNQSIPLKFIPGNETDELETRLHEAESFTERIKIAEAYLIKFLAKQEAKYNLGRIEHTINLINQTKGSINIDILASEACFSRKQYERVFSRYIGATPKQFLKTVRFQNAIDEKAKNKNINLTALALKCGYYDQAHMINDFRKLSGLSPKKYFRDCEPYSDYFQ